RLDGGEEVAEDMPEFSFTTVDEVTEDMFTGKDALLVEMMTENYHTAPIEAVAVANDTGVYVMETKTALESDVFKDWLQDETKEKYFYDAKKVTFGVLREGIEVAGITFDLQLAAYLINPADNNEEIPAIAKRYGARDIRYDEEVYGKGAKQKVPEEDVLFGHVARKAAQIFELKDTFVTQLDENEQLELLEKLELPLAMILAKMEHTGIKVDTDRLHDMGAELSERLETIEKTIYELAGSEFNINSPKQLGVVLFEDLELPVIKKTKTGYSTAADVLDKLEPEHEIISHILHYRQLKKLQSTYVEGLLKVVHEDTGKV